MVAPIRITLLAPWVLCFATPSAATGQATRLVTNPRSVVAPSSKNPQQVPIPDLLFSHSAFSPAWSPDGKQIVFTSDVTGRFNLWRMAADGGIPIQLLQADNAQDLPLWSPDGAWIVFRQDNGGDEIYDLYAVRSDGGAAQNLTDTPGLSEDNARFSPDGARLAITVKPKESATADVAVMDWRTHRVTQLTHETDPDRLWQVFGWSGDGRYIFANRVQESYTDAAIYRIDAVNGGLRNLTPHVGDVMYIGTAVAPSGDVLFSSNARAGYQNVGILRLGGGAEWITDTEWEGSPGSFSADGRYATYQINKDGRTTLYLWDVGARTSRKLSFPEGITSDVGIPTSFSPDGRHLLVYHEDSQRPPDLWTYDLRSHRPTQVTHSALASLSPASIPPSQLVHYQSFDGLVISAYVWMPFNLERDGLNAVVVLPHGGPTGQTIDKFNPVAAALASRGFICISPNVRGSTGYGMAFQKANIKDLGGGDLQDEIYATRFLVATGYANPHKIGITGESYGGYVTLLAIGKAPDVWSAAASEYGIADWQSLLRHTDPRLQEYVKSLLGDPVADLEVYRRASPITYLDKVTAPVLLLQGENDPRVPKEEAQQIFDVLKSRGTTVELHYYPQEGHGFEKRENRIDALGRIVDWFITYLR